jgi:hypothetical protein
VKGVVRSLFALSALCLPTSRAGAAQNLFAPAEAGLPSVAAAAYPPAKDHEAAEDLALDGPPNDDDVASSGDDNEDEHEPLLEPDPPPDGGQRAADPSRAQARKVAPWDAAGDPFAKDPVPNATVAQADGTARKRESVQAALRLLFTAGALSPAVSSQNPGNRLFRLPQQFSKLEARPDLTARLENWTFHAKPRAEAELVRVGPGDTAVKDRAYLLEWYARWAVTPSLYLSGGSEYLQWGPSQLISPSNMFFLENARLSPIAQIPGSYFGRAVWVMTPTWTTSAIVNFQKGERQEAYRPFERRYALKVDYTSSNLQFSAIAAYGERSSVQVGANAVWVPADAAIIYADARADTRSRVLYPTRAESSFGYLMKGDGDRWNPAVNVLAGASYTMKANVTLTAEYLYQSDGYGDGQARDLQLLRGRLADAILSGGAGVPEASAMIGRALSPGLRFLRRHYGVLQARYQWGDGDGTISLWWIANLEDQSSTFVPSFDIAVTNHVALVGFGMINIGPKGGEFRGVFNAQGLLGAVYTF